MDLKVYASAIREGGRTVGAGVVSKLLHNNGSKLNQKGAH